MKYLIILAALTSLSATGETLYDFLTAAPAKAYGISTGRHRAEFAADQIRMTPEGLLVTIDADKQEKYSQWFTFSVPAKSASKLDWYGRRFRLILSSPPTGRFKGDRISIHAIDAGGECFEFHSGKDGYDDEGNLALEFDFSGEHSKGWGAKTNNVIDRPLRICSINIDYLDGVKYGEAKFLRIDEMPADELSGNWPRDTISIEPISTDMMHPGAAPFSGAKELRFRVEPAIGGKAQLALSHDTTGPAKNGKIDYFSATASNGVVRFKVDLPYEKQYEFFDLTIDGKHGFKIAQAGGVFAQTQAEAMRLWIETVADPKQELHIYREGKEDGVNIVVYNPCAKDIAWDTTFELTDFFNKKVEIPFKLTVAAKTRIVLKVPQPLPAKGLWRVTAIVKAGDGSVAKKETRFAYLDLHEVTPKLEKPKFRMGIHYHGTRYWPRETDRTLAAIVAAGAKFVRTDYSHMWADIERRQGEYNWQLADEMIDRYLAAGLACDIIFASFPRWATIPEVAARLDLLSQQDGIRVRDFCYLPREGLFRDFCEKYARRYGTKIDYYECGNEWDLSATESISHDDCLRLQREAYEGLHAGCKDVCVIPNGWTTSISRPQENAKHWNVGLLAHFAQHPEYYDAWAFHCHGIFENLRVHVDNNFLPMRESTPLKARPWLLNETALTSHHGCEDRVARHVWMKILFGWSRGASDYIWYNLRATGWFDGGEPGYGLITADYYPRAGYAAFSALATIFQGLDADGVLYNSPDRHLLRFRGKSMATDGIAIAGWDILEENSLRLVKIATDAKSAKLYDLMGNLKSVEITDGEVVFPVTFNPQALVLNGATRAEIVDRAALDRDKRIGVAIARENKGKAPTFRLEGTQHVKNIFEANPAMVHRLWQGNADLSAKVWLWPSDKGVEFKILAVDDIHAAGDGIEFQVVVGNGAPMTYRFAAERRNGKRDIYRGVLPIAASSFGLNLRVLEDDGDGPDGWLYISAEGEPFKQIWVPLASPLGFKVTANHSDMLYRCGETARLTVEAYDGKASLAKSGIVNVVVDNFGNRKILERKIDLAKENPFVITGELDQPGFMRMTLTSPQGIGPHRCMPKGEFLWSVGYEPEKIRAGSERPADFDEFWANAVKNLDATVPEDIKIEREPILCTDKCEVFMVSAATYGKKRVYGILTEPKDLTKGPYPVRINIPGAGPAQGGATYSATNYIHFTINVHSYPTIVGSGRNGAGSEAVLALHNYAEDELARKYQCVRGYKYAGVAKSREDYFYYASLLGVNRLVNWLARRKEVDHRKFLYYGTSQGGGFGFYLCALNRNFTKATIYVPAITDFYGYTQGDRRSGWPRLIESQKPEHREAAIKNAVYFDAAHFAASIKIPVRVYVGFSDNTCPPAAVYAGYNAIPSKDKKIYHGFGMGHTVFSEFYDQGFQWLIK